MIAFALKVFLLIQPILGYKWVTVRKVGEIPDDMVTYTDRRINGRGVCYMPGFAGGAVQPRTNLCYVAKGIEHQFVYGFKVLVRNDPTEQLIWKPATDLNEIKKNGIEIKNGQDKEYVCAVENAGPGRLVIWDNNKMECLVAVGHELRWKKNILVLMVEHPTELKLTDVKYYMDDLKVMSKKPLHLADAQFINRGRKERKVTQTLTYTKSRDSTWDNSVGMEVGMAVSVEAGVPLMAKGKWALSAKASYQTRFGKTNSESISVSLQAEVDVPPKHRCKVRIVAKQFSINVPYQATSTAVFADGTTSTKTISGVYDGVSVSRDAVKLDKCTQL